MPTCTIVASAASTPVTVSVVPTGPVLGTSTGVKAVDGSDTAMLATPVVGASSADTAIGVAATVAEETPVGVTRALSRSSV